MVAQSTEQLLADIGEQLRRRRISKNQTQLALAGKAGISRRTVQAIERGESISLGHFIEILRILDLLELFADFSNLTEMSPLLLAKQKGKERFRARKPKDAAPEDEYTW